MPLQYLQKIGGWARQLGRSPLYPTAQFACTAHLVTLWVTTILLRQYVELIALWAILAAVLAPFAMHSPSQVTTLDVL